MLNCTFGATTKNPKRVCLAHTEDVECCLASILRTLAKRRWSAICGNAADSPPQGRYHFHLQERRREGGILSLGWCVVVIRHAWFGLQFSIFLFWITEIEHAANVWFMPDLAHGFYKTFEQIFLPQVSYFL